MKTVQLGQSNLGVTPICLGTMTLSEQVDEALAHTLRDHTLALSVNWLDIAAMYAVPPRAETFQLTETIIGMTARAKLCGNNDAYGAVLSAELLQTIDAIRAEHREPTV
jgi:aryl-alcohol dehydrogenase-like predicted oxidoreductase